MVSQQSFFPAYVRLKSLHAQLFPPGGRLVSGRTSVRYRFGSPFSSKVVVCGHGHVTLSLTINKTLRRLSSLPILMQVILVVTV